MREYKKAELMNIGTASVFFLVLVLLGAVFIYKRCKWLSRSDCVGDTTGSGTTVETERMMELVQLKTHQTVVK